jgi:hypothetical protein
MEKKSVSDENSIREEKIFKTLIILVVIVLFLIIFNLGLGFRESKTYQNFTGELGSIGIGKLDIEEETGVYLPDNCTNEELIKAWESIFNLSSGDITILNKTDCSRYLLYKILPGNETYILIGGETEYSSSTEYSIAGIHANLSKGSLIILNSLDSGDLDSTAMFIFSLGIWSGEDIQGIREIDDISVANDIFHDIFIVDNSTWSYDDLANPYFEFYNLGQGLIFQNISLDVFTVSDYISKPINLTQTENIPNLEFNRSKLNEGIILENYFDYLGDDGNLSFTYGVSNTNAFGLVENNFIFHYIYFNTSNGWDGTTSMNITLSHPDWNNGENVTTNNFNVTVRKCLDLDMLSAYPLRIKTTVENKTLNKTDYCVSSSKVMEYACDAGANIINISVNCANNYSCISGRCVLNTSVNNLPRFDSDCNPILIDRKLRSRVIIDMENCFSDADNDSLTYRYVNSSNPNIIITRNNTKLTIIPNQGFFSNSSYFYMYADDGEYERSSGRVYIRVFNSTKTVSNPGSNDTNNTDPQNDTPIITSVSDLDSDIYIFKGNKKRFTISADNYNQIKWFLDGRSVKTGSTSYETSSNLSEGNHTIRVEVSNGLKRDSKTWTLIIEGDESGIVPVFEVKTVILWVIIVIIAILIVLVAWLFYLEVKRKGNPLGNLGISASSPKDQAQKIKNNNFNIPGKN